LLKRKAEENKASSDSFASSKRPTSSSGTAKDDAEWRVKSPDLGKPGIVSVETFQSGKR
jgi:hypothetical protein